MSHKAFTLIEILVTAVILGLVAFMVIPNFTKSINRSYAQDAMHNLIAIYAAQQYYNQNNSSYCTSSCDDSTDATNTNINSNLSLNTIPTGSTTYNCKANCSLLSCCTATNANFTMQVVLGNAINTGSTSVPLYCGAGTNPCCQGSGSGSCP